MVSEREIHPRERDGLMCSVVLGGARIVCSALLALGVMSLVWASAAFATERVALLVGNGGYSRISKLVNPVNDAALMARTLDGLGFEVSLVVDADREAMNRSIKAFGRRLARGGDATVGLFYYAGHGVEANGRNYLIPLNAEIASETELRSDAVPAEWVLSWMEEAGNRLNMVILDACRNNPYGDRFRSARRGLGRVDAPSGSLIAYSAAPGRVAADGKGANSPYTAALATAMREPGLKLEDVFKRVRLAVERETNREQTPWESSSLTGDFYFVPRPDPKVGVENRQADVDAPGTGESPPGDHSTSAAGSAAPSEAASDRFAAEQLAARRLAAEIELLFWQSVKDSGDPADIRAYLDQYPRGTYGVLARNRLKRLESAVEHAPEPGAATETLAQASADSTVSEPAAQEEPSASPPAPPAAETIEVSLGLERSERRRIQSGLESLGFDPGPADGLFGQRTRGAISAWQSSRGEAQTRFLDAESAKFLLAAADDSAWARAKSSGSAKSYGEYVSAYPAGRHVAEARRLRSKTVEAERLANERRPGRRFRDCAACPDLTIVPAGSYRMGAPPDEEGRYEDEGPSHDVTIAQPMAVGVYEVTFGEWDACLGDGGCSHIPDDATWGRVNRPVIDVSWEDARQYVRWLSRKTGERYRLLSESEWEYMARGGTTTRYHWGDETGRGRANCAGCGSRWDGRRTSPTGSFPPNAFGLYDVHGNVWEWVEDCWHEDYEGAPSDGEAWTSQGDCARRVLRGGSAVSRAQGARSAVRGRSLSHTRNHNIGFRVARELR